MMQSAASLPSSTLVIRRPTVPSAGRMSKPKWGFAEWFVLSQTFIPALLFLPGSQPFRVPIRVASYGISLAALICYYFSSKKRQMLTRMHPALLCLVAVVAYLAIMLAHPTTNNFISGLAQIGMYVAVMAPVVWAKACVNDAGQVKRLLWLLLVCNGINASVGVMQVRNPAVWMPREFSSVVMESEMGMGTALYEGADGNTIITPPGLGDTPGAVAGPAMFALYLGLVFAVSERRWWKKVLAGFFAAFGAEAIFLTLVRSSLLIAMGMVTVFLLIQLGRGRVAQAGGFVAVAVAAVALAYFQSLQSGGEHLAERFGSIFADNPVDFYYNNRGNQVASGFSGLLPLYPFGAGLGRTGMTSMYFANPNNLQAQPIFTEIQWPVWIVDGGVVLLLLYPAALLTVMWQLAGVAFRRGTEEARQMASIIFGANTGLLALCFSYAVFLAPVGVQFWFLAGAAHAMVCNGGRTLASRNAKTKKGQFPTLENRLPEEQANKGAVASGKATSLPVSR